MTSKKRDFRLYDIEFQQVIRTHGLTVYEGEVLRRILARSEWKVEGRGILFTTLTDLADPNGHRLTFSKAVRRLCELGLIEVLDPFERGQTGRLRVPVAVYEVLVPVVTSARPGEIPEPPLVQISASDEVAHHAPLAQGMRTASAEQAQISASTSLGHRDRGQGVGNRAQGTEGSRDQRESGARFDSGPLVPCPTCGLLTFDEPAGKCCNLFCASRQSVAS